MFLLAGARADLIHILARVSWFELFADRLKEYLCGAKYGLFQNIIGFILKAGTENNRNNLKKQY